MRGPVSDPAVEAAYRYRGRRYPEDDGLVGAAREALRPVREWCEEWKSALNEENVCAVVALAILDDLAKLIYSSEELAR